jgi:hypothetical protein
VVACPYPEDTCVSGDSEKASRPAPQPRGLAIDPGPSAYGSPRQKTPRPAGDSRQDSLGRVRRRAAAALAL